MSQKKKGKKSGKKHGESLFSAIEEKNNAEKENRGNAGKAADI